MPGAIRPNRPLHLPELPVRVKEENPASSKALPATAAGKGKQPIELGAKEKGKPAEAPALLDTEAGFKSHSFSSSSSQASSASSLHCHDIPEGADHPFPGLVIQIPPRPKHPHGPERSRHDGTLLDDVSMPGTPTSPGSPAHRPGPFEGYASFSSHPSTALNHSSPQSGEHQSSWPQKLDNLSTKAKVGLGAAGGIALMGAVFMSMPGSDDSSSGDQVGA